MTYAVLAPTKTAQGTQVFPVFITDDQDEAVNVARSRRSELQRKGYDSWAKKVAIKSPITADAYWKLAERTSEYGHMIDDASSGNSFRGQALIDWANILRVRADEIANPESYAD